MAVSVADHLDVLDAGIYTVGWICAVHREYVAATELLDEEFGRPRMNPEHDNNTYTLGRSHGHYVVIAVLPKGEYGTTTAAGVARDMLHSFPNVRIGLMVGIGGGAPTKKHDICLGDIVVGVADRGPSVFQYDYGKTVQNRKFQTTGYLNQSPPILRSAVNQLRGLYDRHGCQIENVVNTMLNSNPKLNGYQRPDSSTDRLYKSEIVHPYGIEGDCADLCGEGTSKFVERRRRTQAEGNTRIHYGLIASANQLMKDADIRDKLASEPGVLCFEMEAAGLMNYFPCLVIRGICDYSDSHKNKDWQGYAAFVAAAYAKDLLSQIAPKQVKAQRKIVITDSNFPDENGNSSLFNIANFLQSPLTVFVFVVLLVVFGFWRGAQNINTGQQINSGIMSGKQIFNYGPRPEIDLSFIKSIGVRLGQAPYIDSSLFIGRAAELVQMRKLLRPGEPSKEQHRLVLGGVGGIGKTQLAIAYAREESSNYDSILWMDATSEATLKSDFRLILESILDIRDLESLSTEQVVAGVKQWLSQRNNTRWLLILDSYDEPSSYDLTSYYPHSFHGSIIVTTRLPGQVQGSKLDVSALNNVGDNLQILQTRSQRSNISSDFYARKLADRLAGFPLALATAGAYLRRSTWTFQQYLQEYEKRWNIDPRRPVQLPDYQRTLHTTWDMSYQKLYQEDPDAAHMLKLTAYFSHQSLWFELLHAGKRNTLPDWLQRITGDAVEFDSVMRTLAEYCFVDAQSSAQVYSIHPCVHDWTLFGLNKQMQSWAYWYAFHCVAESILRNTWENFRHLRLLRFVPHAVRLTHDRFNFTVNELDDGRTVSTENIARLLMAQVHLNAAEIMFSRVLLWKGNTLGYENVSSLSTVDDLGTVYEAQGKLAEAEKLYLQALAGKQKALDVEHPSVFHTMRNLGGLYWRQGKLVEAEATYLRALTGNLNVLEPAHISTLSILNNLGTLYVDQDRHVDAERAYTQALTGYKTVLGVDHTSTLAVINNLGSLYHNQGKLAQSEVMYKQALAGYEKVLGAKHTLTLDTVNNLGVLYRRQGKFVQAETMYKRALAGFETALGAAHVSTITAIANLGTLYADEGILTQAKNKYERALAGYQKVLGADHPSTLGTINNLGNLYMYQGKLGEAEAMYRQALVGRENALGMGHTATLETVNNLGNVYMHRGELAQAEEMYQRALIGKEKALGAEHVSTLETVYNLGNVFLYQGRVTEADIMFERALLGMKKALGSDHRSVQKMVHHLGQLSRTQGRQVGENNRFNT